MLGALARNTAEADSVRSAEVKDRITQSTQWEAEIAKIKTRLADDSAKLAASAGKLGEKAARAQVAEDKENLAAFEKMEAATGPVAAQREVLAETEGDRWTVWGEYAGSGLLVMMGLGLMVSSSMGTTLRPEE